MINKNVSSYVNAIFELSFEVKMEERYFLLSKELLNVINEQDFVEYLSDYNVSLNEKEELLKKIYKDEKDLYFCNWLIILIKYNLVKQLAFILNKLIIKYNNYKKIANGVVWTTIKLNKEKISLLEEKFSKLLNKKVELTTKLDPTILGGVKIEIDGKIWDNTIAHQIKKLSRELIEKEMGE